VLHFALQASLERHTAIPSVKCDEAVNVVNEHVCGWVSRLLSHSGVQCVAGGGVRIESGGVK
jgi:hypothetical protein